MGECGILGQLNSGCHSKLLFLSLHTDGNYLSKLERREKIGEADESQQKETFSSVCHLDIIKQSFDIIIIFVKLKRNSLN